MKNFCRAVRITLRYRVTLAFSVACALGVAVLWGGNIGVIYPFVEVVFKGQSMPVWVDEQIALAEAGVSKHRANVEELGRAVAAASPDELRPRRRALASARLRLESEEQSLARNRALQPWIHRWTPEDPFQTLLVLLGVMLVGTLVKDVFLICSAILVARLAHLTTVDLRKEFYRRTIQLDLASFDQQGRGDLMSRFTSDVEGVGGGVQTIFGRAIREPLKMVACLAGAAFVCWRLLLISLVIAPLAGWLLNRLFRSLKRANRRAMEEMAQIYNTLSETFSGIKVVKAFTMERYEIRRFHKTATLYFQRAMRIARYNSLVSPLTELLGLVMISMAILAGAYLTLNQATHIWGIKITDRPLGLGGLMLFYGFLVGASDPARKMSDVFARLQRASAASDRIYSVLDREPAVADPPQPVALPRHHRDLVFENISFRYRPDEPVLAGVSLRIAHGESIALVGPNGCGKSTLASLVLRFFDPSEGAVQLDGIDLRNVRLRDLRRQIGLVTQEPHLFDDTVSNNIRYGAPKAKADAVEAAARQAHAHSFITRKLAEGYETVVGPGGNRLSGGQRQRIALARAILRDPSILILDEATSQIDLESERVIHQVLEKFIRGRTTILITHRTSTLQLADRVVVMGSGGIEDVGTHEELLTRNEFYRRLFQVELKASA